MCASLDEGLRGPAPRGRTLTRQDRATQTRRDLIRTAGRLWSERGFDTVTVEDICSAAGLGRTTFYLHFESKEHLLRGLARATGEGVAADLVTVADQPLDVALDTLIRGVVRRMEVGPKALATLVIRSWRIRTPDAPPAGSEDNPERFADMLRVVLTEARDRAEVMATVDAAELGEVLGAITMDAIESWASGRTEGQSLDRVLRSRFGLVVDQFRSRPLP